jgi:hypothetical protein
MVIMVVTTIKRALFYFQVEGKKNAVFYIYLHKTYLRKDRLGSWLGLREKSSASNETPSG